MRNNFAQALQKKRDDAVALSHYMSVGVFRSALHDLVSHDQRHVGALRLQLLDSHVVLSDVSSCSWLRPNLPSLYLDNINLRKAFSALQVYGSGHGGRKVSALVVSTGDVWMRCSVVSGVMEAAHGWVAVTGLVVGPASRAGQLWL